MFWTLSGLSEGEGGQGSRSAIGALNHGNGKEIRISDRLFGPVCPWSTVALSKAQFGTEAM